jgi:deoxyadenosine/deoxycytidine kinase
MKEDLAIIGMMASGKSSIGKMLAKKLDYRFFEESFEGCPTLEAFYQDPKNWSLETELWFLIEKAKQSEEIGNYPWGTVCDSPIQTCVGVFIPAMVEDGHLSNTECGLLMDLYYGYIDRIIPKPTQFIYLKCPSEVLLQRIKSRGREFEQNCNESYLSNAVNHVEKMIEKGDELFDPIIVVDGTRSIEEVVDEIVERI